MKSSRANYKRNLKPKVADSWSSRARTNSIIVIIAMLVMGWYSGRGIALLATSSYWTSTQGVIVVSKIGRSSRGLSEFPRIEYSYKVNGVRYIGNEIDFGQWSYDIPHYLSLYPVGRSVSVYYDPAAPKDAVLSKSGSVLSNLFGCLFAFSIAGGFIYYRFIKRES